MVIHEGEDFTINCSSSQPVYALRWFRQKNSEGLISLMMLWKNGEEKSHEEMMATLDEKKPQSSLRITASQPSHSGTYLCSADAL